MSIRTLAAEAFQVWIADRGIGRVPQDGQSDRLDFTAGSVGGRWPYPGAAFLVPQFLATLLSAVRRNERYWMYPERGVWSPGRHTESGPQARVWTTSVKALGVPAGLRGAVGFNSTDWNELCSTLFVQVTLGPEVRIEASVIPESGTAVLNFGRDRAVWCSFREQAALDAVAAAMERAGYSPLTA